MSLVSLYDEASLWMTPSGVKDGRLYSELPVPKYGPEEVTNGDFATDSDWTIVGSNIAISGGKANFTNAVTNTEFLQQAITAPTGLQYRIQFEVSNLAAGDSIKVRFPFQDTTINSNGLHTLYGDGTHADFFRITPNSSTGTFSIDDVSVKEVSNIGDFTFSRGSNLAATRVGADGLIEKGRENLALYSNKFNESYWQKLSGCSIVGQTATDPFGVTNNAWVVDFDGTTNARIERFFSGSAIKTMSVYVRTQSGTQDVLIGFGGSDPLITKTITTTWQRIENFTPAGLNYPRLRCDDAVTLEVFGFQLEVGLAATEYIESGASTGKAGLLEDEPRLDYSGGATCPSLLLEPSRTNIIQSSEYFQDDYWAELGVHEFDTNTTETTSPTGDYSATKIVADTTLSNNHVVYGDVSQSLGTQYAVSIFAKAAEYDYLFIRGLGLGGAGGARFNISTGEVVAVNGYDSATIEDYGNGWYRCIAIGTSTTTGAPYYHMSPTSSFSQFAGNDSDGIYIFGAQCEQGSYATSYIPNHSGGSVTRGADTTATLDLSPIGLNGEDVTHFIDFKNNQFIARDNGGTTFRFSSNTANHGSLRIYRSSSSVKHLTITLQDNNGNFSNPGGYEMTSLNPKVAIKRVWATGEIKAFVDGKNVLEGTSTLYNSWNKIDMAGTGSTAEVKQLISFPIALTDSECVELTINGIKEDLITAYKKRATTLEEGASERLDTYLQSLEDFIII